MSNRKPSANHFTQQAAARVSARQQYRPPIPCKKVFSVAKPSSAPVYHSIAMRNNGTLSTKQKALKLAWYSTIDVLANKSNFTGTELRPPSGNSYKSSYPSRLTTKPTVRKMGSKKYKLSNFSEQAYPDELSKPSFDLYDDNKSLLSSRFPVGDTASKFGSKNTGIPDFYDLLKTDHLHAESMPRQKNAKFCHECGTRYPIDSAKFCEYGKKRTVIFMFSICCHLTATHTHYTSTCYSRIH